MAEPVSRGRREITEITHIAPVRAGVIAAHEGAPNAAPTTYADRLKIILEAFQRREDQGFPNVIRMFRGIHSAQWALIDGDTRLLLNVVFDGDWYDYMRTLAAELPAFLHLIWSNCEGWERLGYEVNDQPANSEKLMAFIKAYQVRVSFFYAQHPELTVRDIDWLQAMRSAVLAAPEPCQAAVLERLHETMRPISTNDLRTSLLAPLAATPKPSVLERAETAFTKVIGGLYSPRDFSGAFQEAFGHPPNDTPVQSVGGAGPAESAAPNERELQSLVLRSPKDMHCARMLFLQFTDPPKARQWLAQLDVTFGTLSEETCTRSIAFSYEGLRALNVSARELAAFPLAFRQGMANRKKQLGPDVWAEPSSGVSSSACCESATRSAWCPACKQSEPVHAVLLVYAKLGTPGLHELLRQEGEWARRKIVEPATYIDARSQFADTLNRLVDIPGAPGGVNLLGYQDLLRPLVQSDTDQAAHGVEYFGFRERVAGEPRRAPSELGITQIEGTGEPLLDAGTYLVVRQLEQDVKGFWNAMEGRAGSDEAVALAEALVGRRRNGEALSPSEPGGATHGCPFHSHVGRMSPPLPHAPRLARRGMSYLDPHERRGLMFMALNADIEGQFEFIQRNWVQRGNHVGASSSDRDPLAGLAPPPAPGAEPSPILACTVDGKASMVGFAPFVKLRWGEYFFVPSRTGLTLLQRPRSAPNPQAVTAGPVTSTNDAHSFIEAQLNSGAPRKETIRTWLDDLTAARAFWDYVLAKGGLRVDEGSQPWVFVAHEHDVRTVLGDDGSLFSVSEYMDRMRASTGEFFLGMDPVDRGHDYKRESATVNIIPQDDAGIRAVRKTAAMATRSYLATMVSRVNLTRIEAPTEPARFILLDLLSFVLNDVSAAHFGMPGPSYTALASWGGDIARYHFRVTADAMDAAKVRQSSVSYRAHAAQLVRDAMARSGPPCTLRGKLNQMREVLGEEATEDHLTRNLLGIVTGALGATIKMFAVGLSIYAARNTRDGKLVFPTLPAGSPGEPDFLPDQPESLYWQVVRNSLTTARCGAPDNLYRKYVGKDEWPCRGPEGASHTSVTKVKEGDLVAVWIGGTLDKDAQTSQTPEMLFGAGPHACPGWRMGTAIIDGILLELASWDGRLLKESDVLYYELLPQGFDQLVSTLQQVARTACPQHGPSKVDKISGLCPIAVTD